MIFVSVARLPDEPPELAYSLLVGSSDITVRLSWEVPFVPVADPPITGYKVVWGPVLPPVNHLLMDRSLAESRELPKVHVELIFMFFCVCRFGKKLTRSVSGLFY